MLPRNHPDRIQIAFDDRRLVANAGLILPATLALRLGLPQLVDRHLGLGHATGRANECLGTKAKVQEKMYVFFDGLTHRKDEVRHRCRTLLPARADALMFTPAVPLPSLQNVVPT